MSIRQWPDGQRPRERMLAEGPSVLSDAELLAALLRTGVPGRSALTLAQHLLSRFRGLRAIASAEWRDLRDVPGIGPAKWVALRAAVELARRTLHEELRERDALESPGAVREFLALWLRDRPSEAFVALFLDNRHRLIAAEELFRGTLNQTAVYPREIVRRAIALNAAAIVFAHNHPSGAAEPSGADRALTEALRHSLAPIDVRVLDHLIVAGNHCVSFAELGLL